MGPLQCGSLAAQEYCETCPTEYQIVTRDPALADNAALPAVLLQRAGDRLFQGLLGGYDFGQDEGVRSTCATVHVPALHVSVRSCAGPVAPRRK